MKKKLTIIFLLLIALTAGSRAAVARQAEEGLTAEETGEARRVAESFVKRLEETKDVGFAVPEFFAPDFIERQRADTRNQTFLFIERDLVRRASVRLLRRYHLATLNFYYLHELYLYSKSPVEAGDADRPSLYSPQLRRLLARMERSLQKPRNSFDSGEVIARNVRQLQSMTALLEQINALLRADVRSRRAEQAKLYKEAVDYWDSRFQLFKPWLGGCDEGCYGLPVGGRLITVNVPSLQLHLARVGGSFKIIAAVPYFD